MFMHVGLEEDDSFVGVEAARKKIQDRIPAKFPQSFRILHGGECVEIDNEIDIFLRLTQEIQIRLHRTEVVAQMQLAGGLNTGEDAHERRITEKRLSW